MSGFEKGDRVRNNDVSSLVATVVVAEPDGNGTIVVINESTSRYQTWPLRGTERYETDVFEVGHVYTIGDGGHLYKVVAKHGDKVIGWRIEPCDRLNGWWSHDRHRNAYREVPTDRWPEE